MLPLGDHWTAANSGPSSQIRDYQTAAKGYGSLTIKR